MPHPTAQPLGQSASERKSTFPKVLLPFSGSLDESALTPGQAARALGFPPSHTLRHCLTGHMPEPLPSPSAALLRPHFQLKGNMGKF